MKILSFAAAGSETIHLGYCPQTLSFSNIGNISGIKVTNRGTGNTVDLSTANQVALVARLGQKSSGNLCEIDLGNGVIIDKNCDITITATGACDVYAGSKRKGNTLFGISVQKCQASSSTPFSNFIALVVDEGADDDSINVYGNGFSDTLSIKEVRAMNTNLQALDTAVLWGTDFGTVSIQQPNADFNAIVIKRIRA